MWYPFKKNYSKAENFADYYKTLKSPTPKKYSEAADVLYNIHNTGMTQLKWKALSAPFRRLYSKMSEKVGEK